MNSIVKNVLIALLFLVAALVQYSFFPHLAIWGIVPNLVFISFLIIIFLQKPGEYDQGISAVVLAGIVLDLFSPFYFGVNILALACTYVFVKLLRHFLQDTRQKFEILYFAPIFIVSLLFYQVLYYLLSNFPHITFAIHQSLFIVLLYNILVALVGFGVYDIVGRKKDRQLKLF